MLEDAGTIKLADIRRFLGDVLQEAGDARRLQQQGLVVLHQQTLVTSHVLQDLKQLGALRTRQRNVRTFKMHLTHVANLRRRINNNKITTPD